MRLPPYQFDELRFAYACHVYYRWHTYRNASRPELANLAAERIEAVRPDVHILNLQADAQQLALLASLRPTDSVAIGASKIKGGASKLLSESGTAPNDQPMFGTGYFACTTGPRTSEQLDTYLENQADHHGYGNWKNPPVYVRDWPDHDPSGLQSQHSRTSVRWHMVFCTWNRVGTFTSKAAAAIVERWERLAG